VSLVSNKSKLPETSAAKEGRSRRFHTGHTSRTTTATRAPGDAFLAGAMASVLI